LTFFYPPLGDGAFFYTPLGAGVSKYLFSMKRVITTCFIGLLTATAFAQDINVQLKEAVNLERQVKEPEALAKYKEILATAPTNVAVLVKCTELTCSIGDRQVKNDKHNSYTDALNYAQQAIAADSNSADANYAMALAKDRLITVETENKKIVELEREVKIYADKALALNATHARANYLEGKWHYDIVTLPGLKLTATKLFHKGFPDADIDTAISYMEKCRTLEQYFAANYLVLAKAYKFKKRPAQAVEVLNKLVKLPTRTGNDIAIKTEGQQLLSEMQ